MFLKTHRKIYQTNFGLKGLILLSQNPDLVMAKDMRFLLYAGLICHNPDITFQEIDEIIAECDLKDFEVPSTSINKYEIEELYTKAVGEIGIAPTDFYSMSPQEINWAYEGYLRRKETEANLTKMAIMGQDNDELIRLTEDKGYIIGNMEEREQIFKELNISKERD